MVLGFLGGFVWLRASQEMRSFLKITAFGWADICHVWGTGRQCL
jgi:hypothetical protein